LTWFFQTLDRFLAGAWIALFALAAAQVEPFAAQYAARSAAALAKAEAHLADVQTGLRFQTMAAAARAELEARAREALADAKSDHAAVTEALPLLYPLALARNADAELRAATWNNFTPALPASVWAVALTVLGAMIGFAAYEAVKWPVLALLRTPRRRFKKRGGLI